MKKIYFIILIFILSEKVFAQSFSGSTSGHMTVSSIMNLRITSGASIGGISLSGVGSLLTGLISSNCASFAVKSNELWLVEVKSTSTVFTPLGLGSLNMPASVLGVRVNGTSSFTNLSTTAQTIKTGNRGDESASGNTFNIDLNFNPGFSYKGDIYLISLQYTITKQ